MTYTSFCDTVCVTEGGDTNGGVYIRRNYVWREYNIESCVFRAAYELAKQGIKPADIREQLQMLYVREAIKTTRKLLKEGDSISDMPEFEPLFLCEEAEHCEY